MSEASLPREILHREGFYPEESSGLFVGISSFVDDSFVPVPFAVDDAVDLAWVFVLHLQLVDPKRTVLALAGEPRKQISRERLDALLQAGARRDNAGLTQLHRLVSAVGRSSGPRGLFVLTAATHGLSDQGGDYLVATDTLRDGLLDTALKLPTLLDRIAQLPAKRRLVLLDACRERMNQQRSVADADPAMAASFAAAIGKAVGQTVLMASVAGGYSYDDTKKENGVFSGALVDGLCGAAPADSEGLITVGAVADFADARVRSWVKTYRREHANLSRGIERRYDELAGKLPLAIDLRHSPARTRENTLNARDGERFKGSEAFLPPNDLPVRAEQLLDELDSYIGGELGSPPAKPTFRRWALAVATIALLVVGAFGLSKQTRKANPPAPHAGARLLDSFGMAYRYVPPGQYAIGSPSTDRERDDDETERTVTIEGFWLAETEMTQEQWKLHVTKNPSKFYTCATCPVEGVSWWEAAALANLLSNRGKLEACYDLRDCKGALGIGGFSCAGVTLKNNGCTGYRLPTEEEWEVAARAQAPSLPYQARYGVLSDIAWWRWNSGGKTHPIGRRMANRWGFFDLLGNVSEWTNSTDSGIDRIFRGGSWDSDASDVRAAFRSRTMPELPRYSRYSDPEPLGFRFAVGQLSLSRNEDR